MKKYLLTGFFILCLSLFLLLLVVNNEVYAQEPTETPTPTIEIEPFFETKTPIPLGDCPIECVIDDGDLPYEYLKNCEDCICTKTPAFPTKTKTPTETTIPTETPIGFTPSPTTTTTPTPEFNLLTVKRFIYPSSIYEELINGEENYTKYEGIDDPSNKPESGVIVTTTNYNKQSIAGFSWLSEGVMSHRSGFPQETVKMRIKAGVLTDLHIKGYVGDWANTEFDIPKNTTFYQEISNVSGYWDMLQIFDVIATTKDSNPQYSILISYNNYYVTTGTDWYESTITYYDGGVFEYGDEPTPTQVVGMCNAPVDQGPLEENEFFNGGRMYWVGSSSCIDLTFMQALIANETIQNWLEGIIEVEITPTTLNLCFRQFTILPVIVAGISVDIIAFLYIIVGAWAVLTIIGGLNQ